MKKIPLLSIAATFTLAALNLGLSSDFARADVSGVYSNPYGPMPSSEREAYSSYGAAVDPGVRSGAPGAGGPLASINQSQSVFFADGRIKFIEVEDVPGGLGPRFNSNACASCHSQPAVGGTSPASNPLLQIATQDGASNRIPWFITANGPVREVRFKQRPDGSPDGGVHNLFTITGRRDAGACSISQPDFQPAGNPLTGLGGNPNLAFRIPTPLFGSGLIEAIPDAVILANQASQASFKVQLGIRGRPHFLRRGDVNRNPNDGTIARFGWKAQNKSLLLFSAEAYNVEMGVTNEVFTDEREQAAGCVLNATPEDSTNFTTGTRTDVIPDMMAFANFMRLLAPPTPAPDTPTIVRGRATFSALGCAVCHTPSLRTAQRISAISGALPNQPVNLYSDLLLHNMGSRLADGITQGGAGPDEFRTAPLWGLGQRVFFLHDGRTKNLAEAIRVHQSNGSEANKVVDRYNDLSAYEQQDLLNFLRSL